MAQIIDYKDQYRRYSDMMPTGPHDPNFKFYIKLFEWIENGKK